jgi:hypothetical protein
MPDNHRKVCLLSRTEAKRYLLGQKPCCRDHRHATASEVMDMIRPERGMRESTNKADVTAKWIDARHAVILIGHHWQGAWNEDGFRQMQLLRQGERGAKSPFPGIAYGTR